MAQETVKRLYDKKAAADSLSISPRSIERLVARGLLKPNRTMGKLLFTAAELDRFAGV